MASQHHHELLCFSTLLFLFLFISISTQNPETLVLPVIKDPTTLLYITAIYQRTPLVLVELVVDIGSRNSWVDCEDDYISSSCHRPPCNSSQCSLAESNISCINNDTCGLLLENSVTGSTSYGELIDDVVNFRSVDGSLATVPHFLFACGSNKELVQGLATGVQGVVGFGFGSRISTPVQLSSVFNIKPQFALCLSSTGFIFVGNGGNYNLGPGIDVSSFLKRTPLIISPKGQTSSSDYFIGVSSIKIDGKEVVKVNTVGGTKINTVTPFTTMQTSIYKEVTRAFIKAAKAKKMKIVAPVKPFNACFSSASMKNETSVGLDVPIIDLVLGSDNQDVYWRVFGANSMVEVRKKGVVCLGFVDGGLSPPNSIVIGGHQLENNFFEFDLSTSVLRFSSSLLLHQTKCADFNFKPGSDKLRSTE